MIDKGFHQSILSINFIKNFFLSEDFIYLNLNSELTEYLDFVKKQLHRILVHLLAALLLAR